MVCNQIRKFRCAQQAVAADVATAPSQQRLWLFWRVLPAQESLKPATRPTREPLGAQTEKTCMFMNNAIMYDITPHIAEIYDQSETYTDDIELIKRLIEGLGPLRILEPFCGTGRILVPLALAGHTLVGLDKATGMLSRARTKINRLAEEIQSKITLIESDVVSGTWPSGFELVILGSNCFYELSTPEEQEECIMTAFSVLNSGGYVYVDNNHMEGDLDKSWQVSGKHPGFPTGKCNDGTSVETSTETTWYDIPNRLAKFHQLTKVKFPDGSTIEKEYFQQKHPVSTEEVRVWLETHGFIIEQLYGDRTGNPYSIKSNRAIFWARKPGALRQNRT
jgi:SAM-dependent methyltransferase